MSSRNVAQTLKLGCLLCVIICSFIHSSFFMQSKNSIPCEIGIFPPCNSEAPLSYLEVSLRNVFIVPILLFHPRDLYGIWQLVSGARYIFVIFSIESRRTGCLSPSKSCKCPDIVWDISPLWRSHSVISNAPKDQTSCSTEHLC